MTTYREYMAKLQAEREKIDETGAETDFYDGITGLDELVNGSKQPPDDYAPDLDELEFRGRKKYIPDDFENRTRIESLEEFWSAKAQEEMRHLLKKISAYTPDKILTLIHSDKFKSHSPSVKRVTLCAASFALSDKGIAPYWQQLRIACEPGDDSPDSDIGRLMLKKSDAQLYDMYWLSSSRIKRAKISSTYFNRLRYGDRFNMDNAIGFASRDISAQRKISMLGISAEMEIGCLALYSSETSKLREAAKRKAGLARWGLVKNKNAMSEREIEADRRLFAECAHLGGYKPTATANILSWRSGEQKGHRYVSVKLKRLKLQKPPSSE